MGRLALLFSTVAAALLLAGPAAALSRTDERVAMDDGVEIATTLYLPDGAPPAGGWPAVMIFHGLGQKRQDYDPIAETVYATQGYAVLAFDARGHGESGGVVTLDGPRELADVRALFTRLAARADVDERRIGGWGVSYGGGAVLRAAVEGVGFAAIEPHITWTSLYDALLPQDFAKSGVVFGFVQSIQRPSELVTRIKEDALASRNLAELRRVSDERSSLPLLSRLTTPTFLFQGRRDFAFGMEQAIQGFSRLAGPKRLYFGNLGHAPSTFVSDDLPYFTRQGRLWFDRFLKGMPNGIDARPPVELAPSPFAESRIGRYRGLPATRPMSVRIFGLPRTRTIGAQGKVVRDVPLPRGALETFGSATVSVTASTARSWPHLVAVLSAITPAGEEIVVSAGGVPTRSLGRRPRTLRIRMLSTATFLPSGSRLRVTLAATSLAQNPGNLVYLQSAPSGSSITIGTVSLTVPALRTPVSR